MSEEADFKPQQEADWVHSRRVWVTAITVVLVIVVAVFVSASIERAVDGGRSPLYTTRPRTAPPQIGIVEQTLVQDTARGLDLRRQQREELNHYGWVDRSRGIARIPIDRAIDLVIADGGT